MRWIREHKLITSLVLILMTLVIIFVVTIVKGGGSTNVTGIVHKGMSYVSKPFTVVAETVRETFSGVFSHKELQKQIEGLQAENEQLKRDVAEAKLDKTQLEELQDLAKLLNYDYTRAKFEVVTADITSMDGANWTNIFTIDRGVESGIEEGAVVISGAGLIGKVSQAGDGWAKVVSIIDDGSKVSFKVARDKSLLGIVSGNVQGKISGYMLEGDATVSEGDIIITSGLGTYPQGLEIGNIKSIIYNSDTLLKEITVEPAVDFKSIKKVSVIL